MKKDSIIRTIYLYIFALLGLALIIIGSVRFLDMGLKAYVFTKADQELRYDYRVPSPKIEGEGEGDTVECPELMSNQDYITSRRHKDASINLSLILVGLPLYLYHWGLIRRESREKVKNLAASE